jgi:tripartite-type tricarboxylate transporter receptor subunit TctC
MRLNRRTLLAGLAAPALAHAQATWPAREVRIIVPFPPGGTTDVLARMVAETLRAQSGQPVVVENAAGAGGTVGATRAARMAPDGTSLLLSQIATHGIAPALYPRLDYHPERDFAPVIQLVSVPNLLVAHPQRVAARTLPALIEAAKARPATITAASSGNGTSTHLSIAMLQLMAGIELLHVPYRGAGPALVAITGGEVDLFVDNLPTILPQVRDGRLVPIAVTAPARSPQLPDVPTVAEAGATLGLERYAATAWFGLHAQAGVPAPVLDAMNAALDRALAEPALKQRLEALGNQVVGGPRVAFGAFVAAELAKWAEVVRAGNVRPD